MIVKKIFEYKIVTNYGKKPTFKMKCYVYDVEEIINIDEEKWFYGTRNDGFNKSICKVSSLDSNRALGDGIIFYSEIQENEKEVINKLLERTKQNLDSQRKNSLEWERHYQSRIEYIESKMCFDRDF